MPLPHLADYVDRLTAGLREARHARHLVRARVGRHAARAADPRHAPRRRGEDARDRRGGRRAMVREYKGAFSGEHGDGLVRSEWVAWQFGPRLTRAFEEIKALFDPDGPDEPGQDRARRPRMDDASLFRYPAGLPRRCRSRPALDWSAWNVHERSGRRSADRARHRRRSRAGLRQGRRDVQQQRPLPQVRRRHDVPELSRHARRAAPDARPREHAAPRACRASFGPDVAVARVREALDLCVSCKGCRRDCPTGVDMAKMKIEFLAPLAAAPRPRAARSA